ncbi:amino acid adenylation domain-containing protein [Lysobacter sp. BMK333-48F3]|uniref:non-ribosomal peptide synthetase n=1 Tax=Lysobacter sp. BMK333-48F3 TaxID=2867962 RepID=UPI001C8C93AE|nr:non-ribosomal peptide synthetase [Lysobacter sp. BMK333-48F3]MBX9403189.1 amino acid adenylation domain-containing protein [Lysobacter sp. BMK333-48F3]
MNAIELLRALQARGLSLRLDGEKLRLLGEPRALAESELVQAVRERKPELIALLRERDAATADDYRIDEGTTAITPKMLPLAGIDQAAIDRLLAQVPGGTGNVQDVYPLAPLQEGILFHHRLHGEGESDAYVMPTLLRFDSRERLDRFVDALREVVARHDILRTSVHWEGLEQPLQVVHRQADPVVEILAAAPGASARESLQAQADPRRFRLDVRQAPMLRGHAVRDPADGGWLLQLLHHHLILDHTASELLVQEVMTILQGQRERLPVPVPFRRFVAQARRGMGQPEHEAYFRRELGEVDETTAPFGLSDVQGDGSGVVRAGIELEPGLARRLREQARARGVGAASLFHLAWAQVLGLCSGRDEVVFGTVLFGRLQAGADAARAMGMFLNTLPLRVKIDGRPVEAALRGVHASLAELLGHEHASLSLAQRCSALPANAPLFASLLNYRYSQRGDAAPALDGIEALGGHDRTNYPFVLHVDDYGDGFGLTAEVERSVDAQRVCGFAEQALRALADALEREPQRPLDSIERLPASERAQVLHGFNATDTEYPRGLLLHQLFERQAAQRPDATAVVFEGRRLSYAELNARANRLARRLRLLGVGPDARVGICLQRSEHLVIALLATLKAGGAYLPLDPAQPAERLQQLLDEAAPVAVLTEAALEAHLPASSLRCLVLDRDATASVLADTDLDPADTGLGERHLAYVIYTSGSTGRPKGVMNEHRGIVNRLHWMQQAYALTPQDVVLQKTPFGFDVSVWEFFWPLMIGAQLVLAKPEGHKDPAYLGELIRAAGVTTLHFVPSMLQVFLARLDAVAGCASLRRVVCSGEALPAALARQCRERLPQVRLYNLYGPTEAAVDVTAWDCSEADVDTVPIGRPIANTRIYLLDASLRPVPVGVVGELYIGGVQVARGYLDRPELTAERFVADPFEAGGRLYRSGDLARWREDGAIEYLGRNDFQVKLRGQRIELGEIEAQLRALDGIADAVVVAREDRHGALALVAYVVPEAGAEASPAALRERLAQRLPEYMLPGAYVALEALPLSGNGKLDRKALPAPGDAAFGRNDYEPPQGEVEQALAAIWSQLLGIERIGRHDGFFALGGHSLLAVQLLEHLRRRDWSIDVRAVFAQPELAAMAAAVRRAAAPGQGEVAVPRNAIPERFDESSNEQETEEFRL